MNSRTSRIESAYERHRDALIRHVQRAFGFDTETSEDIVAEVFAYVLSRAEFGLLAEGDGCLPQLIRYSNSKAISEVRRRKRQAQPASGADVDFENAWEKQVASNEPEPLDVLLDEEKVRRRQTAIESALRDFTDYCETAGKFADRAVFELRVVLGRGSKDVSERMGLPVARVHLLTHLSRRWIIDQLRTVYDVRGSLFASRYGSRYPDSPPQDDAGVSKASSVRVVAESSHHDQTTLEKLVDDELDDAMRVQVVSHLDRCEGCRRMWRMISELDTSARAELLAASRDVGSLCPSPLRLAWLISDNRAGAMERLAYTIHIQDAACTRCRSCMEICSGGSRTVEALLDNE